MTCDPPPPIFYGSYHCTDGFRFDSVCRLNCSDPAGNTAITAAGGSAHTVRLLHAPCKQVCPSLSSLSILALPICLSLFCHVYKSRHSLFFSPLCVITVYDYLGSTPHRSCEFLIKLDCICWIFNTWTLQGAVFWTLDWRVLIWYHIGIKKNTPTFLTVFYLLLLTLPPQPPPPHRLNASLSPPISPPVSLSPTQFDAMLIRLLLISRIVLLPQTFEMYTPFNLFCLSGVVGWMPDKNWIVFPPLQRDAISMSLA